MKTLHLNLKRKWFDMILSGEKKEEYREFKKYWIDRLTIDKSYLQIGSSKDPNYLINEKPFSHVIFSNGYSKNRDQFVIELISIEIKEGKPEWGAEKGKKCFVLKLGEIIK